MIGRREVRSHNSWLHNTPKFRDGTRRHRALVNPADADAIGAADGATVRVVSARGYIEVPIELSEDVAAGTIAVPHGWGHRGAGWQTANAAGGANVNELTSPLPEDLERLSGMAHLNGVPVRLEKVPAKRRAKQPAAVG
jgi:formate dehydrogenase